MTGLRSYHAGRAAEDQVARHYSDLGHQICASRWRGVSGEIDLIARCGQGIVFIEVKHARSFDRAAESLSARQMSRILSAGEEFLAGEPLGSSTECRFDLALVDGQGHIRILQNAISA